VLLGLKAVLEWEVHRYDSRGASSFSLLLSAARALLSWGAELLLCQVVEPHASWLAHAAGALAGAACAVTPPRAQVAAIAAGIVCCCAGGVGLVNGGGGGGGGRSIMPFAAPRSWWGAHSRHVYLQ
jgi:hypothetical protein